MSNSNISLGLDQASVTIVNKLKSPLHVWIQYDQCQKCLPFSESLVDADNQTQIAVYSKYLTQLQFSTSSNVSQASCKTGYQDLEDKGEYLIKVYSQNSTDYNCDIEETKEGINNVWPLFLFASILLFILFIKYYQRIFAKVKYRFRSIFEEYHYPNLSDPTTNSNVRTDESCRKTRLLSLDLFRGLTIVSMIFCNNGAGGYIYLNHSSWFGIYFADLIFPAFLFIMGTSIGLSFHKKVITNDRYNYFQLKASIMYRTLKLILLGLIVNSVGGVSLNSLRFPGVLQRLALSYLIVSLVHLRTLDSQKRNPQQSNAFYQYLFADLKPYLFEWIFVSLCILLYTYFTLFFPYASGCPLGYQGPGGLHDNGQFANCTGGAARAIDVWVFGQNHLYSSCTAKQLYQTHMNHDPEGLLGTLTAILITFYGLQVSKILNNFSTTKDCISRFVLWSLGTGLIGFTFHMLDIFPLSKNLFSLSFVHVTASFCYLLFMTLYLLADCNKYYFLNWPFQSVGNNSIALYMGHELFSTILPFYFEVDVTSHFWLLFRSVFCTCLWIAVADWMEKSNIYIVI